MKLKEFYRIKLVTEQYTAQYKYNKALEYLVAKGFAINKHEANRGVHNTKMRLFRELNDNGRLLKECKSIEAYNKFVAEENRLHQQKLDWQEQTNQTQLRLSERQAELSEEQAELSKNQVWLNITIAASGVIVATLNLFQIFEFHEKHKYFSAYTSYFLNGIGLGLLLPIIVWLLWKSQRKKRNQKS